LTSLWPPRTRHHSDAGDGVNRLNTLVGFALAMAIATAALVWLGYVAVARWHLGIELLLDRRQSEAMALASAALNRDMSGAWTTVLAPIAPATLRQEPPYDVRQLTGKAFARFPYLESLVVWRRSGGRDQAYIFNRADRPPPWDHDPPSTDPFPVVMKAEPAQLRAVFASLQQIRSTTSFVSVMTRIEGTPYQVVGRALVSPGRDGDDLLWVAFTVNLAWVRSHYFGPLLEQVSQIGGAEDAVALAVTDSAGQLVAGGGGDVRPDGASRRRFVLSFIDPSVVSPDYPHRFAPEEWTLHVGRADAPPDVAGRTVALPLLALMAMAAAVSAVALFITVRAAHADARLASMKHDFVAAVTHDLKTPVALIRLVGDTLARHRYSSAQTIEDYAGLLSEESTRLSRSIDNLLTYSRYTDPGWNPPAAPALRVIDLVEDALEPFRPLLAERRIALTLDVPPDLPAIAGDRPALVQVIESIVDNAVKYSDTNATLAIVVREHGSRVLIDVIDEGIGIPNDEVGRVCDRFYRGSNVRVRGSGLGLAIARRIVTHHKGTIVIRSALNAGTTVEVSFPRAS
jgi:signal transduction histidine kinase